MASKKNKLDDATIKELDALFAKSKMQDDKVIIVDGGERNGMSSMAVPVPMVTSIRIVSVHDTDWCNDIGVRRILK